VWQGNGIIAAWERHGTGELAFIITGHNQKNVLEIKGKGKSKGKRHPRTDHQGPEGE
jgi:hypothetical protein